MREPGSRTVRRPRWPLSVKLAAAVFMLGVVPMLLVGLSTAREVERTSERREIAGLERRAADAAKRVEERVDRLRDSVDLLARNPMLVEAAAVPIEQIDRGSSAQIALARAWDTAHPNIHRLLVSVRNANAWFEHIYLLDLRGVCIASSEREAKPDMLGRVYDYRPYFRAPLSDHRSFVSDILKNANSPGTAIFVSAPVMVEGVPAAIAVIKVSSDAVNEVIASLSHDQGRALLVDRFGVIVSDAISGQTREVSDPESVAFFPLAGVEAKVPSFRATKRYGDPEGENYLGRVQQPLGLDGLWAALRTREADAGEYELPVRPDGPSSPTITGFAPVWSDEAEPYGYVMLAEPAASFRRPLERLSRDTLLRLAIVLAAVATTLGIILRRLTRRIERLAQATGEVADGDLDRIVGDRGQDELGQLAESLGRMTNQLALMVASLRQREAEAARARDEAVRANAARGAFMARLGEEVQVPLGKALAVLDRADDHVLSETGRRTLRRTVEDVLGLADEMLAISAAENSSIERHVSTFDLDELLAKVVQRVGPLADLGGSRIELALDEPFGDVSTDRRKLDRILLHVCTNACKFTRRGTIRISGRRLGDHIEVEIADQGIGLTRSQIEQVQQAGDRPAPAHDDVTTGAGYGLAVSGVFARMLGGTLTVTSEVGHGSTFMLRFPAHLVPEPQPSAHSGTAS